ncbi:N-acetylglucosamine kinase [Flammeovirgaceae bacterium SG7u.111]|nr:N-acetylglucosamine kinase [Flammeovirgaceae bacterium SG7u.132]WPO38452.1 N-acetylglucosamine kinase [Flammeovirgaceae bacterium SG7u.111]
MIVIADSGSTKTEWWFLKGNAIKKIRTKGINPYYQSSEQISESINDGFKGEVFTKVTSLFFYGAGCNEQSAGKLESSLESQFPNTNISIYDDLLAVARATCQHEPGTACILGTGSNSCFYDGEKIINHIPSLGFVLGDEGSGAVMGKKLINLYFKKGLTSNLEEAFRGKFQLSEAELLQKVYKEPYPNRYLAQFSKFLAEHKKDPFINSFILLNFKEFLKTNTLKYEDSPKYPIHFCGSIAYFFQDILKEAIHEMGLPLGSIHQTPMEGLKAFHLKNKNQ